MLHRVIFAFLQYHQQTTMDMGLGNCKTKVALANVHRRSSFLALTEYTVSSLQTTFLNIIHALVYLHK